MTAREALRAAFGDFYRQSWRLLVLNLALAVALGAVLVAASYVRAALLFVVCLGPLAAALMHCAVTLASDDDLRLREALAGLRLHWRRGLELGAVAAGVAAAGSFAVVFYGGLHGAGWALAFLTLYLLLALGFGLLVLLALATAEPALPLRALAARALGVVAARPGASVALAAALLLVNLAGLAAALMPFLTLTVAFSFLAAAHFALPRPTMEAAS